MSTASPHPCDGCAGYAAAAWSSFLRDVAGWIDDDIADGLFDGTGDDAARSIAARLRDQAGRAALEAVGPQHSDDSGSSQEAGRG